LESRRSHGWRPIWNVLSSCLRTVFEVSGEMSFIVDQNIASHTDRIMMDQRGFVNCVAICGRIPQISVLPYSARSPESACRFAPAIHVLSVLWYSSNHSSSNSVMLAGRSSCDSIRSSKASRALRTITTKRLIIRAKPSGASMGLTNYQANVSQCWSFDRLLL
jgi:hypothetical protein